MPPLVEVWPHFQWSPVSSLSAVNCRYESLDGEVKVNWFKNDVELTAGQRVFVMHNGTRIEIGQLTRSDTGAYACRVQNKFDEASGQDIASILVQVR